VGDSFCGKTALCIGSKSIAEDEEDMIPNTIEIYNIETAVEDKLARMICPPHIKLHDVGGSDNYDRL
jgi:hypothetical protein